MKHSKLFATVAMAGLASTMIGCSRNKDEAKAVPAAQTLQHKGDECPAAGMYVQAGEDGSVGPRRVNIVQTGGILGIAEFRMANGGWEQDMLRTFQVANVEEEESGASRLAKCSEGSIIVTYSNVAAKAEDKKALMSVKYEPIDGGKSLRVTTTDLTKSENQTSSVSFVRYTNPAANEDVAAQADSAGPASADADASGDAAPAASAPAALAPVASAPVASAPVASAAPSEGHEAKAAPMADGHDGDEDKE